MPRPGGGDIFTSLLGMIHPDNGSKSVVSNASPVNTAVKPVGDLTPPRANLIADPNSATGGTMGSTPQRKNLLGS